MADPGPARGITVTKVTMNQGVTVDEMSARHGVEPLPGRPTLLRFWYDIDESLWDRISEAGRNIEARLSVRTASGTRHDFEPVVRWVFRDSTDYNLETTFNFELEPEWVVDGVEYRLELYDVYPELAVLPGPDSPPALPPGVDTWERLSLSPESDASRLEVVVLPYAYEGNCTGELPSEQLLEAVQAEIFNQLPVSKLRFEVSDPIPWATPLTSLGPVLDDVAARRAAADPAPNVYYAGLIDVCSDCPECSGGLGYVAEPTQADAPLRASVAQFDSASESPVAEINLGGTLVHELGHNHGLSHNVCNDPIADPGTTNPGYPHQNGIIGTFGYRFSTDEFMRDNGRYDIMSYCYPRWVSDWTWGRIASHMEALASAERSNDAEVHDLFVSLDEHGRPRRVFWARSGPSHPISVRSASLVGTRSRHEVRTQFHPTADGKGGLLQISGTGNVVGHLQLRMEMLGTPIDIDVPPRPASRAQALHSGTD